MVIRQTDDINKAIKQIQHDNNYNNYHLLNIFDSVFF